MAGTGRPSRAPARPGMPPGRPSGYVQASPFESPPRPLRASTGLLEIHPHHPPPPGISPPRTTRISEPPDHPNRTPSLLAPGRSLPVQDPQQKVTARYQPGPQERGHSMNKVMTRTVRRTPSRPPVRRDTRRPGSTPHRTTPGEGTPRTPLPRATTPTETRPGAHPEPRVPAQGQHPDQHRTPPHPLQKPSQARRTPPQPRPTDLFADRLLAVLSGERPVHSMLRHTVGRAYDELAWLAERGPSAPAAPAPSSATSATTSPAEAPWRPSPASARATSSARWPSAWNWAATSAGAARRWNWAAPEGRTRTTEPPHARRQGRRAGHPPRMPGPSHSDYQVLTAYCCTTELPSTSCADARSAAACAAPRA